MGKKGYASREGAGEIYEEPKSARVQIVLTPTALQIVDAIAKSLNVSRSEIIEQLIRGTLRSDYYASITPDDTILFITVRH